MKLYVTTHTDGTISYSSGPNMVIKPNDIPATAIVDVPDEEGQQFMDNPSAYAITDGKIVKL